MRQRRVGAVAVLASVFVCISGAGAADIKLERFYHEAGDYWMIVLSNIPAGERVKIKCALLDDNENYLGVENDYVSGPVDDVQIKAPGAKNRVSRARCWTAQ